MHQKRLTQKRTSALKAGARTCKKLSIQPGLNTWMEHPGALNADLRSVVEAFYAAYSDRDFVKLAGFLADDVEWTISGPVDVLPFCGTQRGRAAVLKWLDRDVSNVFRAFSFKPSPMLVDGDQVARLNRVCAKRRDNGRVVSYRLAQFIRFRNNKVIEYVSIIDSFDAVEQVLGHPLSVHEDANFDGDLIAV